MASAVQEAASGEEFVNREGAMAGGAPASDATIDHMPNKEESASEGKDKEELSALEVKDTDSSTKDLDPEAVKAPGLMDRAKEEVEAMTEALQEKLDLNKDEAPTTKDHKEDQPGVFKRLLKKLGWSRN